MLLREATIWTLWAAGGITLVLLPTLVDARPAPPKAKIVTPKPAVSTKLAASGERVFRQQCAPCHGATGEGTKSYPRVLAGDQSVGQLARYIAAAMPPGPKKCSVADAPRVAAYIHEAFYSPLAQERNRPARVALSRLTVRQLKNAVTDLVGSFRTQVSPGDARGLRAEYFRANQFRAEDRVVERIDPEVRFNYGQEGPSGGKFDPHQFSMRWQGSLVAPDTGVYEIVVRTEHATNLWINDLEKPIIDAWVQSGKDTEHTASIYLVGGRAYPIRLEFSKSKQGVDDSDKNKDRPVPKASITLAWKRPRQIEEPIPSRCLLPTTAPEAFVVSAPFPPDDRSMGYERGNSISKEWDEAATSAALETSDYIAAHLEELAGSRDDKKMLMAFCRKFVERAHRRPLAPATDKLYIERQFTTAPDSITAVKRVVLLTLKSPRFLYRELGTSQKDPYDVASRLSFALWDSLPDETLLKAAASGTLVTREQVTQQAKRMVADPRAWYKQREFFLQWLKIDQYPDLAKDAKRFPQFTPAVAADLRTSLDLSLESVVRSERSDFRELLLTNRYFLNGRLAPIYGVTLPANAPFQPVSLDPKERSGVLTHPYLLASFAYRSSSSPIHRGVLLTRSLMGRTLAAPPAAFVPLPASLHPNLTTRQRVSLQTKPAACMSCHSTINLLGFTLEKFDAIGRVRAEENGTPIDTTGSYEPQGGQPVKFAGARDLSLYIAKSEEAHTAFVEKFFQFLVKQPIRAYGQPARNDLQRSFRINDYNMRHLAVEIATEAAFPKTAAPFKGTQIATAQSRK